MIEFNAILHPTDFSEISKYALPYAIEFAKKYNARLDILHVLELPYGAISLADEAMRSAQESLRALIPQKQREGIEIVPIIKRGKASEEIVKVATDRGTDLIVLATHGHSGLEHALLGSTAERVVRKAPCPVLTIRNPGRGIARS